MSDFLTQKPVILASGSFSRKILLDSLGIKFQVVHSDCDEEAIKKEIISSSKIELAKILARHKALAVSERFPEHIVIAADQLCVIDNDSLDKPGSHAVAIRHLRLLSGKTHQQISACCIAEKGEVLCQFEDTASLTMNELTDEQIESYLLLDKPYQSCGAYHFEGMAKWLFSHVNGSEDTIRGLPLVPLANYLLRVGAVTLR